jgi:hypothetical protein
MGRTDDYRVILRSLASWDEYLRDQSGLPGPRGNLELAQAVADEGDRPLFLRYAALSAAAAPINTPDEFLTFCGVVGMGRLLAEGDLSLVPALRSHAADSRWRVREGVAMALQRLGDVDMPGLLAIAAEWAGGAPLQQRAAAAAVCEPRLLRDEHDARAVVYLLDGITASIPAQSDRRSEGFVALRKGLGYCWSVAVAALPKVGKPLMEKWMGTSDRDILWIMKENLKKKRLERIDPEWVSAWRERVSR